MATYSTDELARKVLAMYARDGTGSDDQILSRQDMLAQWPKGFTHVELTTALEYGCSQAWLAQTEDGFRLTQSGFDAAGESLQQR
jgi:hypothetical protein